MKTGWKLFCYSVMTSVFLCGMTGCQRVPSYDEKPVFSNLTAQERTLLGEIDRSGIQVIRQGMVYIFMIPTDCFFTHTTHELKRHRPKDLDRLALFVRLYMRYYQHPRVTIIGYTDKVWLMPTRKTLSLHYAQIVADYFRMDDVNPDRIIVKGMGAEDPIASNGYPMGTSFNKRVTVMVD